ncbi:MAG: signal peptidase I [Christensenellales bacterium]|nr:signal peptidase I [Christensenellales bacterium]
MKRMLCTALVLIAAASAGLLARTYLASPLRIAGTSMQHTLMHNDIVLVTRFKGSPQFGDVVECRFPGRDATYVKRVIGLPGDIIRFSEGTLTRNGALLSEPYVSSYTEDFSVVLGADQYLVLGDNRVESFDSRESDIGFIHSAEFSGRVFWILWPLDRFGPVN